MIMTCQGLVGGRRTMLDDHYLLFCKDALRMLNPAKSVTASLFGLG